MTTEEPMYRISEEVSIGHRTFMVKAFRDSWSYVGGEFPYERHRVYGLLSQPTETERADLHLVSQVVRYTQEEGEAYQSMVRGLFEAKDHSEFVGAVADGIRSGDIEVPK